MAGHSPQIVSYKAQTPPRSGDLYLDAKYGRVRLIKMGPGDSWICRLLDHDGTRLYLRPKFMRRIHSEDESL